MFTIVVSKKDLASMNIYEAIKNLDPESNRYNFLISNEEIIRVNTSKVKETDYFIFLSKHASASQKKIFTVHLIGNWHKADFGGKERTLSPASAHLLKKFFIELNKNAASFKEFECSLEATHHGPLTNRPSLFIEVGSTEKEWQDKKAAKVLAKTVLEATKKFEILEDEEEEWQTCLAFGGGHYCPAFNKLMLREKYAISHICSKYYLKYLDENIIRQAIEKTEEKAELALLDWKGLAGEKERIVRLLKNVGLDYEKV